MQKIPYKLVYEKLEPIIRIHEEERESTVRQDDWGHLDQEVDFENEISFDMSEPTDEPMQ